MKVGAFKYWYTIDEAAQVAAQKVGEPITASDIVDKINYGELRAWFDGTGRYSRQVYLASHYEPDVKQDPLATHGAVGYLSLVKEPITGLMGYYEIYTGPRSGKVIFVPVDETTADAHWDGGNLLLDHDGESLLQVVRRKPEAHISSRFGPDFRVDHSKLPRDKIWIAAEDLRALLEDDAEAVQPSPDLSATERNALHKLLAAMAIKSYEYEPGKKRQKKGVISGIQEHLKDLGISMDAETISKYLKGATAPFAPSSSSIEAMARQVTTGAVRRS